MGSYHPDQHHRSCGTSLHPQSTSHMSSRDSSMMPSLTHEGDLAHGVVPTFQRFHRSMQRAVRRSDAIIARNLIGPLHLSPTTLHALRWGCVVCRLDILTANPPAFVRVDTWHRPIARQGHSTILIMYFIQGCAPKRRRRGMSVRVDGDRTFREGVPDTDTALPPVTSFCASVA